MMRRIVHIGIVNGRIKVEVSVKDGNEYCFISEVFAEDVSMRSVVNNQNEQIDHKVYVELSEGEVCFNADIVIEPDGLFVLDSIDKGDEDVRIYNYKLARRE